MIGCDRKKKWLPRKNSSVVKLTATGLSEKLIHLSTELGGVTRTWRLGRCGLKRCSNFARQWPNDSNVIRQKRKYLSHYIDCEKNGVT